MANIKTYRIFQFLIMTYLLTAFTWWTILLTQKTKENYELKTELLENSDPEQLAELTKEYRQSQKMIIGEGLVFAISIIICLILVYRAFLSEIRINRKLNNFLLSVTHELKTPIASLKLINRTIANKELERSKRQDLLNTAHEESIRLENLVNNILAAAQMDNNYLYNFEMLDFVSIIEKRVKRFQKLYREFSIEFENSLSDRNINADKEAVIKIIDNLIDNAIKYSGDSKKVIVRTDAKGTAIVLKVIDFGLGIDELEKDKILDKFYRIENEETRTTKGTGLGLFIVNEICKAHKAVISILDNDPQGSIFEIKFPKL